MSELALPLLALLTAVTGLAVVSRMPPTLARESGSRQGTPSLPRGLPAGWVTLALALLLSLCSAGALAMTVLGSLGGAGLLLGIAGVLMATAAASWLPGRFLGVGGVLVGGAAVGLLIAELSTAVSGTGSIPALLGQDLSGSNPAAFQLFSLLWLCWVGGAWIGWFSMRERNGAIACALPLVILVADLVNVAPDLQGAPFWPVAGATISGLALIGWTHQEREMNRWSRLGIPWSGSQPRHSLMVALGCALAITVVALVAPPLNSQNISGNFFRSGPDVARTSQSNRIAAISGYSTSVVPGGPIRQVKAPILSYRTSAPGGTVYLRGVTLSQFSNGNWYEAPASSLPLKSSAFLPYDDSAPQGTTATEADRKEVSLSVTYIGAGAQEVPDLLYAGSPLTTPTVPATYQASGEVTRKQLLTVTTVVPKSGITSVLPQSQRITTYGSISTATAAQLESAGTDYPAWVQADTSLPPLEDFVEVNQIASDALAMSQGATNPYQIALNIQNALRSQEIYTLDPPATPAGVWPIVYFLNDSHRGYCQYFASAMGALLRTLGIPARLVSGFGPGEEGRLPNGQWLITEADAHTWVQVYFPGYGWVNFEPTPDGFYQPTGAAAALPGALVPTTVPAPHAGVRPANTATKPVKPTVARRHRLNPLVEIVLGALAILLLALAGAAVAWVTAVRTPRQLRRRLELPVRLSLVANPHALTLTQLAGACAELHGDTNSETNRLLRELARRADRLAFSGLPAGADGLEAWAKIRSRYPMLLWHGWREGRRRRRPVFRPTAVRIQSI